MEQIVKDLAGEVGEREACLQLGHSRASFRRRHVLVSSVPRQQRRYQERRIARQEQREKRARRRSSLALSQAEQQMVLDTIHQPRFIDRSVPYIHATLWDEGTYHCSMSTKYRLLRSVGEVGIAAIRRRALHV